MNNIKHSQQPVDEMSLKDGDIEKLEEHCKRITESPEIWEEKRKKHWRRNRFNMYMNKPKCTEKFYKEANQHYFGNGSRRAILEGRNGSMDSFCPKRHRVTCGGSGQKPGSAYGFCPVLNALPHLSGKEYKNC
jgi:hypothetical protein